MSNYPKITLAKGKDKSLRRFHPWVFSGAIKVKEDSIKNGDVVDVYSSTEEYLGTGHYNDGSISVRLLSFEQQPIEFYFWRNKIQNAYELRKALGLVDSKTTNAYRLVAAEGDGLPGLIIDYYNGVAVVQAHTLGMYNALESISKVLQKIYGEKLICIYNKSKESLPKTGDITANGYLFGEPILEHEILENSNKFLVSWEEGQKTGFFIDQRENRQLLQHYSNGKKVLNTFCYTGAFSVYAANAGALQVDSVDSSEKAIELTNRNMQLNGIEQHTAITQDAFSFLKQQNSVYDLIILDPPAFAKSHRAVHNAIKGYRRINEQAIKQIKPGGVLFTFSCSQSISKEHFKGAVFSAAINARRNVKVLHHLSQSPDHPSNIYHPEGDYLKGLVLYVE